jgi:hypothetical protein
MTWSPEKGGPRDKSRPSGHVIPRALRHRDVAAQTWDRVEICLMAIPDLHRTTMCCDASGMTRLTWNDRPSGLLGGIGDSLIRH